MAGSNVTRIVLLGKTGSGKSSLGNTILRDSLFKIKSSPNSETDECKAESKLINGASVKVIDTPGLFGNNMDEEKLKREILQCIKECETEVHAFLIVLEVGRFTDQEKEVISKIKKYFSDEALKHSVVVFTHGDQLDEGQKIEDFVQENPDLRDLVRKCGGRCHVVDNKYWKDQQDGYRSNRFQVNQLLNTIETMKKDQGRYTNTFLQLEWSWILEISAKVKMDVLLGALLGSVTVMLSPYAGIAAGVGIGTVATGAALGAIGGAIGGAVSGGVVKGDVELNVAVRGGMKITFVSGRETLK